MGIVLPHPITRYISRAPSLRTLKVKLSPGASIVHAAGSAPAVPAPPTPLPPAPSSSRRSMVLVPPQAAVINARLIARIVVMHISPLSKCISRTGSNPAKPFGRAANVCQADVHSAASKPHHAAGAPALAALSCLSVGKLSFRALRRTDLPFVMTLGDEVFADFTARGGRDVLGFVIADRTRTEVAVQHAGDEAKSVGFVVVRYDPSANPFGAFGMVSHLDAIATTVAWRRQGIGRALLARAEEISREVGARSMALLTAVDNEPARSLFEGAGYATYSGIAAAYHGARGKRDALCLIKRL